MCGRYALTACPKALAEVFDLDLIDGFPPRYNIAPTQPITVVAVSHDGVSRRALLVRWGLLPAWVKDVTKFPLLFNARSETAAEKASFRAAMRHRRVLVPATGFYEWRKMLAPSGRGRGGVRSQPYWIRPRQGGLIAFAGLTETYVGPDGAEIDTGAILTTQANRALAGIHERMPVVVKPEDFARWLDCRSQEPRNLADILAPVDDDFFETIPVGEAINTVANDHAATQEPASHVELMDSGANDPARRSSSGKADDQMTLF